MAEFGRRNAGDRRSAYSVDVCPGRAVVKFQLINSIDGNQITSAGVGKICVRETSVEWRSLDGQGGGR